MNKNSNNSQIELRGVNVHNLKDLDLDIPHHQLVVFCGVSGSGKTSIALDTLYAEGQRRYIESFSAYTRQFLDRLEKPAAARIEGIPAAIAVTRKSSSPNSRSTIGTSSSFSLVVSSKLGWLPTRWPRIPKLPRAGNSSRNQRRSSFTPECSSKVKRKPFVSRPHANQAGIPTSAVSLDTGPS